MRPIPLFVELCAGTAAVSLRLHSAEGRPPVARIGSKLGYADAILRVMGLLPGQQAERYLWSDADAGVRMLLHGYADADLASDAAELIRAWSQQDQRDTWKELSGQGAFSDSVSSRELARWCWLAVRSWKCDPKFGFKNRAYPPGGSKGGGYRYRLDAPSQNLLACQQMNADIYSCALRVPIPEVASGALVYIDPPYLGTTGYEHDLSRSVTVGLAIAWANAGARVFVSEAEPIQELTERGWYSREISWCRVGSVRNFSTQQREFLTMSHPGRHPGKPRRNILVKRRGKVLK